MEAYELTPEAIVEWANNHASYEELESTAKGIYKIYKAEQKKSHPDDFNRAKEYRRDKSYRKPIKKRNPNYTRHLL
tara:strand:- start:567 stop:794 length:228 start_codon:yes stop_codon:yes gene_type:complete